MSRNQNRAFGNNPEVQQPPVQPNPPPVPAVSPEAPPSPFNFIVPTEMVDLPSKGEFYPDIHPLHNVDAIEIKHMTAKEEDILTSATLLKKGLAIDKMLQSIIVDKRIKVKDLLIGDKNALVIASRIFGYGPDYKVEIQCVHCDNSYEAVYDLSALQNKSSTNFGKVDKTANNTFTLVLPKSQMLVEFKLLTSQDEEKLTKDKKGGSMKLLKLIVVSINEQTDGFYVERALQSLPILDVSTLKKTYAMAMPDVNMVQDIECTACGEISTLGVPLNAGFFWPDI